ncbi:MAG TPA: imelysin family protein, partial [Woeseiaceae bacterium]|nr:imelysin family protein [Woeseiaceae bacterium]
DTSSHNNARSHRAHAWPNLLARLAGGALLVLFATGCPAQTPAQTVVSAAPPGQLAVDATRQIETYAEVVYRSYLEAYEASLRVQDAVNALIANPDEASLAEARQAWLAARPSYGQTEAFRFYGGPIDAGKQDDLSFAPPGIEGLLNAWPLNEAYIDYVRGNPDAGIINDGRTPITRELLVRKNAQDDETDVTTGYHAIEFLLWGQDLDAQGPGNRGVEDFVGDGRAERRRTYLKVATNLLVDNLKTLADAWAPDRRNYRALTQRMNSATVVRNILTGIATLSGFEMASERLATALDSGSPEDEQSCFSDSTHVDILANAVGIENVYFGRYGGWQGAGINELVEAANPDLNRYLEQHIRETVGLASRLDRPFDETLATPPGSERRARVEALVKSLQVQADLLKQASSALGVPIVIGGDNT